MSDCTKDEKTLDLACSSSEKITILVLGLKGSGKTEILYYLTKQQRTNLSPTNHFALFDIQLGRFKALFVEIPGNLSMRKKWHNFYYRAHAYIYVVDLSDQLLIDESITLLEQMMKHEQIKDKPVLVLANKSDLFPHPGVFDVADRYLKDMFANTDKTKIFIRSCGREDYTELYTGLVWLRGEIEAEFKELKERVQHAIELCDAASKPPKNANRIAMVNKQPIKITDEIIVISSDDDSDKDMPSTSARSKR